MSFRVGQKVVLVKGWNKLVSPDVRLPVKGRVYTVRWSGKRPTDTTPGIMLAEHFGGLNPFWNLEFCFNSSHFRPVVERKTDISIFQRMLTPAKKEMAQ